MKNNITGIVEAKSSSQKGIRVNGTWYNTSKTVKSFEGVNRGDSVELEYTPTDTGNFVSSVNVVSKSNTSTSSTNSSYAGNDWKKELEETKEKHMQKSRVVFGLLQSPVLAELLKDTPREGHKVELISNFADVIETYIFDPSAPKLSDLIQESLLEASSKREPTEATSGY